MAGNDPCGACGFSPTVKVKPVADLWLPTDAVSSNWLKGNAKGASGWRYRGFRDRVLRQLEDALATSPVPTAKCKRRVKFTRWMRPTERAYDDDNLRHGFKPVRDCLRTTGVIRDDNARWLEAVYAQLMEEHGGISLEVSDFV